MTVDHPEDVRKFFATMDASEKLRFALLVDMLEGAGTLPPQGNRPSTGGGDNGGRFEKPYTTVSAVAGR